MKEIALGRTGRVAMVDDADYDWLVGYGKWTFHGHATPYATCLKDGRRVYMHRLVAGATTGQYVDHRDFNGLNNQRSNVRLCSQRDNMRHSRKRRTYNGVATKNRHKGAHAQGRTWLMAYRNNGKYIRLYGFKSEAAAGAAYRIVTQTLHGEYACARSRQT